MANEMLIKLWHAISPTYKQAAGPAILGDYWHVADVMAGVAGMSKEELLERAWEQSNSIDAPWPCKAGVVFFGSPDRCARRANACRSSSVGDLMELPDGSMHEARSFGFAPIEVLHIERVRTDEELLALGCAVPSHKELADLYARAALQTLPGVFRVDESGLFVIYSSRQTPQTRAWLVRYQRLLDQASQQSVTSNGFLEQLRALAREAHTTGVPEPDVLKWLDAVRLKLARSGVLLDGEQEPAPGRQRGL